jgi:hypothetical protein
MVRLNPHSAKDRAMEAQSEPPQGYGLGGAVVIALVLMNTWVFIFQTANAVVCRCARGHVENEVESLAFFSGWRRPLRILAVKA